MTVVELITVIALIGILALIAIPSFISLRTQAFNQAAHGAGRSAKLAQETLKTLRGGFEGTYASSLQELLTVNDDLGEDPEVTFTFGGVNTSGYTMYIRHLHGDDTYMFTEQADPST